MIQLQLKAKHFYYVAFALQDKPLRQFAGILSRMKDALLDNTDMDAMVTIDVSYSDLISVFTIVAALPEGLSSGINTEMNTLIMPQISTGVIAELQSGIVADGEGNLPETAIYQRIAKTITELKTGNANIMAIQIGLGQNIVNSLN
jgi:hypothetical protein